MATELQYAASDDAENSMNAIGLDVFHPRMNPSPPTFKPGPSSDQISDSFNGQFMIGRRTDFARRLQVPVSRNGGGNPRIECHTS